MEELLFDTNIIIGHLRGNPKATALLEKVREGSIVGYISTLTEAELFAGRDVERAKIVSNDRLFTFGSLGVGVVIFLIGVIGIVALA